MRTAIISLGAITAIAAGTLVAQAGNRTPAINTNDLGVVEAPVAGSTRLDVSAVPAIVLHSANVAFKTNIGAATVTGAQVDKDEVQAIYEVQGRTASGALVEADITADGTVNELEIEIESSHVPAAVLEALETYAPTFEASEERPKVEKSIRPSAIGLPEIWYEFSGSNFDVEVRSDARNIVIEPA